MPRSPFDYFPL